MLEFLSWLEQTAFCSWIRDSGSIWAYPLVLTLHTTGMGVLVGFNWAIDLRLLNVAKQMPVPSMEKFFRIMWFRLLAKSCDRSDPSRGGCDYQAD